MNSSIGWKYVNELCKLFHKELSSITTTNSCSVKNSSSGFMSFNLLLCPGFLLWIWFQLCLRQHTINDTLNAEVGYSYIFVPCGKLITLKKKKFFVNTGRLTVKLSHSEKMSVRTSRATLNVLQDYAVQLRYVSHSSQNPQDKYCLHIVCGSFSCIHF